MLSQTQENFRDALGLFEDNDKWPVLLRTRGNYNSFGFVAEKRGAREAERMPLWLEPSERGDGATEEDVGGGKEP